MYGTSVECCSVVFSFLFSHENVLIPLYRIRVLSFYWCFVVREIPGRGRNASIGVQYCLLQLQSEYLVVTVT